MNKEKLIDLLKEKIKFIDTLLQTPEENGLHQWKQETLMILDQLIGEDSKYYKQFSYIQYSSMVLGDNPHFDVEARVQGLQQAKTELNAIIFGLENELFD